MSAKKIFLLELIMRVGISKSFTMRQFSPKSSLRLTTKRLKGRYIEFGSFGHATVMTLMMCIF